MTKRKEHDLEDADAGLTEDTGADPKPFASLKTNDLVRFLEGEKSVNALVLGSRVVPDHLGENGEPLLTLAFAEDKYHPITGVPQQLHGTGQQGDLLQIRQEVAHVSHLFSDEQQLKYGKKQMEGGRWRLLSAEEAAEAVS
jgi:hypothetical protein